VFKKRIVVVVVVVVVAVSIELATVNLSLINYLLRWLLFIGGLYI